MANVELLMENLSFDIHVSAVIFGCFWNDEKGKAYLKNCYEG